MNKISTFDEMTEVLKAKTEDEVMAAALADPDAQPLTEADFKRMKQVPQVKIIRRALGLTEEEFSLRFEIPIGTLRDWEQGRTEPDQTIKAYLKVIAGDPEHVRRTAEGSEITGILRSSSLQAIAKDNGRNIRFL